VRYRLLYPGPVGRKQPQPGLDGVHDREGVRAIDSGKLRKLYAKVLPIDEPQKTPTVKSVRTSRLWAPGFSDILDCPMVIHREKGSGAACKAPKVLCG
jgi:hypothetical protein